MFMSLTLDDPKMWPSGGWPTFTFFVKVGTHADGIAVFILASPHRLIRTAPSSRKHNPLAANVRSCGCRDPVKGAYRLAMLGC